MEKTHRIDLLSRIPLDILPRAFREGGIGAVYETHLWLGQEDRRYALFSQFLEKIIPAKYILEEMIGFNLEIGQKGASRACQDFLERRGIPVNVRFWRWSHAVLPEAPCIFVSNHPSFLSPILLLAVLDQPGLRIIARQFLGNLLPNIRPQLLPISQTWKHNLWKAASISWVDWFGAVLAAFFDLPVDKEKGRLANQRALDRAVGHVWAGNSVLIFPGGGAKRQEWFSGIGYLVSRILSLRTVEGNPCHLVPMHIRDDSNLRHWRMLRGLPGSGRHGDEEDGIEISFYEPISISSLAGWEKLSPLEVTRKIREQYEVLVDEKPPLVPPFVPAAKMGGEG